MSSNRRLPSPRTTLTLHPSIAFGFIIPAVSLQNAPLIIYPAL
jgi:hypothetical protein